MATDKVREETEEENAPDEGVAEDDDGAEADDEEESPEASRSLLGTTPEPDPAAVADEPRNRAERRAAKRRARKPASVDRNEAHRDRVAQDALAVSQGRPRLPPKTMRGKSSSDEEVPGWAKSAGDYLGNNRNVLLGLFIVMLLAGGGFWIYRGRIDTRNAVAATAYGHALDTMRAQIRAADAPEDPQSDGGPTFPDRTARANAALRALRDILSRYPAAPIVPLAHVSAGAVLYDLGRFPEARREYEAALGHDVGGQQEELLEGLGFTLEASGDLAGALRQFEELARADGGTYRDTAQYHQARILIRQNQNDRARSLLTGLLERLHTTNQDPATGASAELGPHAQALLRTIAADDPHAASNYLDIGDPRQHPENPINRMRLSPPGAHHGGEPGGH